MKRRTKEDLDNQVKQKLKREYEEELKEKEGDKIYQRLKHLFYQIKIVILMLRIKLTIIVI